ncbi:MAG: ABC transporter permease [Balneolales bacterium]|nr:ABC transporter permease [Balneolales bacterium]
MKFNSFVWKMAWRETRSSMRRLTLFIAAIVMGVAALVSITSFGENLDQAIEDQAKTLLGADLVIEGRMEFDEAMVAVFDSLGGQQAREVRFSSMVQFPKNESTRLSQIRALEGNFPFYGELETIPADAVHDFRSNPGSALVDESMMLQFDIDNGDSIRVGNVTYVIVGKLVSIPGESLAQGLAGPRIFIPGNTLEETGLIQRGSQLYYNQYFQFDDNRDVEALVEDLESQLVQSRVSADTVEDRKRSLGRALTNLTRFLNLVGFIALLLGGVGIASAIHVYIQRKVTTVAVLRCVGVSTRQSVLIYIIQAIGMGLVGALIGALIGVGIQRIVPYVLADFLPVDISFGISWVAIATGFLIGIVITALFALQPLLEIRRISPLLAIRKRFESAEGPKTVDPLRWLIYIIVGAGILGTSILLTDQVNIGLGFFGGILVSFGLLTIIGWGLTRALKRWFPRNSSYVVRQGLANLYRPNNQTLAMVVTLGFSMFLIATLFLSRDMLLDQINLAGGENQPNIVLYDIQTDQRTSLTRLMEADYGLEIQQDVPIVTMRMTHINDERVEAIRDNDDSEIRIPNWLYQREIRATYRNEITDAEKITEGEWIGSFDDFDGLIPISVEEGVASSMRLNLGDEFTFNVQGVPIQTYVSSFREVNWQQVQPNFIFTFPEGVLEEAPQFHVFVSHMGDRETAAVFQQDVIREFGNISIIDLNLVLTTVDAILSRVSFVIQFMSLFSVITGLIVLSGAVVASRFQRVQESVLLKTLGAKGAQILKIMSVEYLVLGLISALTGLLLAFLGSWALAWFVFEANFIPNFVTVAVLLIAVMGITLGIGLFNSRDIYRRSPLEVLRAEG